jgi:formyltetrahydrofolate synthetase
MSNPLEPLTEAERAECLRLAVCVAKNAEEYKSSPHFRGSPAAWALVARALRIAAAKPKP